MQNGGTARDLVSKNGISRTNVHTLFCLVAKLLMLGKYNKKQKVFKCNAQQLLFLNVLSKIRI